LNSDSGVVKKKGDMEKIVFEVGNMVNEIGDFVIRGIGQCTVQESLQRRP